MPPRKYRESHLGLTPPVETALNRPYYPATHVRKNAGARGRVDFDRNKTLVQLKREKFRDLSWDFYPFPAGYYLRHVPIRELRPVDLLTLIRQAIGLDYLIVLALERLEVNPLLKCRKSEGDLLSAVLCADALVWKRNPHYRDRVTAVWRKVSGRVAARPTPENRMLLADYRWFLKADKFLPKD